ncbi:hypothetical protein [Azohydromonas lata]|uniref:hypothetical protein n=1 Tax=Azohydromonas lata TaxID=45677 RepID=UPI00082C5835|nr:hypothetical protein [Azohydromonas lata]
MTRFVYVSPDSNTPTGGIKVIYKHAELLCELGIPAAVAHITPGFSCDWFSHRAPVITLNDMLRTDIAIVPEIMTVLGNHFAANGVRYCMFVQNGYLVLPTAPMNEVYACYRDATAILSISEDTSDYLAGVFPEFAHKIVRVKYSVDVSRFSVGEKRLKATYMPRKQALHANNLVPWLVRQFPSWEFQPIHGMHEDVVADHLKSSRVFLAFSDFEGCPVPPLEAALCGNVVVGYPGWGGREYWEAPNFLPVDMGDIRQFAEKFRRATAASMNAEAAQALWPGIQRLAREYGLQTEKMLLLQAVQRICVSLR